MINVNKFRSTKEILNIFNRFGKKYKYIVYTAVYGELDELQDPKLNVSEDILFVCFTNRKDIFSKVWNIIYQDCDLDKRMSAKYWKFFGYRYFQKKSKYIIWVDASLKIINSFLPLLNEIEQNDFKSSIFTFNHPNRNCVYSEFFWLFITGKENILNLIKTWFFLKKKRYLCGNGLIAGGFIIRKVENYKNIILDSLMKEWWLCVQKYSSRDQLTFNYLIDKKQYRRLHAYIKIEGDIFNCRYLSQVRSIKFHTKIDPKSKTNFIFKIYYLLYLLKSFIKKNNDN